MIDPPTLRCRHDGWTAARQQAFLAALAATRNVGRAAAAAGISRKAAYALRAHPAGAAFLAAWDQAVAVRVEDLAATPVMRMAAGRTDMITRAGVLYRRHRPCDVRLLIALLNRADHRQARGAGRALVDTPVADKPQAAPPSAVAPASAPAPKNRAKASTLSPSAATPGVAATGQ